MICQNTTIGFHQLERGELAAGTLNLLIEIEDRNHVRAGIRIPDLVARYYLLSMIDSQGC